jgi:hypothetical protein
MKPAETTARNFSILQIKLEKIQDPTSRKTNGRKKKDKKRKEQIKNKKKKRKKKRSINQDAKAKKR